MLPSEVRKIKARWGTPGPKSQYHADIHALIEEVERLHKRWIDHDCEDPEFDDPIFVKSEIDD